MASLTAGLLGGLVATVAMTVVMLAMGDDSPPPTAALVAKFADGDPADYELPGMGLHVLYGIGAGAVFAVAVPLVGLRLDSLVVAAGLGLAYGVVLMVSGMAFWLRGVIGVEPDRGMVMMFATAHVVYGLALGGFLGANVL